MSAVAANSGMTVMRPEVKDEVLWLGQVFADSKMFNTSIPAAMTKLLMGRELGLTPVQAMVGIHVIEGSPSMGANLYASFIRRSADYDYRVLVSTDELCRVRFYRGGKPACGGDHDRSDRASGREGDLPPVCSGCESSLSMTQADERGLTLGKHGRKANWMRTPDAMLFARCISRGAKLFCPDVFHVPVYTTEEMQEPLDVELFRERVVRGPEPVDAPAVRPMAESLGEDLPDFPAPAPGGCKHHESMVIRNPMTLHNECTDCGEDLGRAPSVYAEQTEDVADAIEVVEGVDAPPCDHPATKTCAECAAPDDDF